MDDDEEATSSSFKAYYDLLRDSRAFSIVWVGEVCSANVHDAALPARKRSSGEVGITSLLFADHRQYWQLAQLRCDAKPG